MRPFRFFAAAPSGSPSLHEVTEMARRAEDLGFAGVVLPDHIMGQHAPLPLLTAVAAVTERVRVGTFVLNVDLRHPAVLAQELASLDVLSGGRLDVGIGAGWNRPEYDATGLTFDPVGVRVSRLREAVTVLRGCFADGPFSFAGEHYTITNHDGYPKPLQRPSPPLFIVGGGKRVLTLAAEVADMVGLAPRLSIVDGRPIPDPRSFTLAAAQEKVSWVRAAAGARFDELELNTYPSGLPLTVTGSALALARARAEALTSRSGIPISAEELLESPHVFLGTVGELTQKVLDLRERLGVTSFMLGDLDEAAPIAEALAGR